MKIQALIAAVLLLPAVAGAQRPAQPAVTGQIARCEEMGVFMRQVAEFRAQGVSMSTVVEWMQKGTGHTADMNDPGDRAVLKYIDAIYAEKTTPEQTQKIFTDGCIRGVTKG